MDAIHYLRKLAGFHGVQTAYYDVSHRRQPASPETLLAVLGAMDVPVARLGDAESAWRESRQKLAQQIASPVITSWDKSPLFIDLHLPKRESTARFLGTIILENGQETRVQGTAGELASVGTAEVENNEYITKRFSLSNELPIGYHRFTIELSGKRSETLIIRPPQKAFIPSYEPEDKDWGVFLPLYALHSQNSWGTGDFRDMRKLVEWTAQYGGRVVGTLPLLSALDEPVPSPYMPSSRLLWNDIYIDMSAIDSLNETTSTEVPTGNNEIQQELNNLRQMSLVDYRNSVRLKRSILEKACHRWCLEGANLRKLTEFALKYPVINEYAQFRAAGEKYGPRWQLWPQSAREGTLTENDFDEAVKRYYLYCQRLVNRQFEALTNRAREMNVSLYLDLPIGVHPDGYDAWLEKAVFATDAATGSPPDVVFTKGQNWSFPPWHPDKMRERHYRYFIDYVRHHMRHAGILRIDHMMGFHRLFWIPKGLEASQGAYVRYPSDDLYAITALESFRNKTVVVGEDLGTVSPEVRPAMNKHGLHRMYVLHYELESQQSIALPKITRGHVASLNTHDMPTFASFWRDLDLGLRLNMGLLDKSSSEVAGKNRAKARQRLVQYLRSRDFIGGQKINARNMLSACLAFLSSSDARLVILNLEDLWLETKPQNMPTTQDEYPNWRRKARYSFEKFAGKATVISTLKMVDRLRKGKKRKHQTDIRELN